MSEQLRALLVEDSVRDFDLIVRELRLAGFAPAARRVQTEADMAEALADEPWDVVFSDHSLPGFDAATALQVLQRTNLDTPFIIISGMIGEERAVDLMKAGAHDYVSKQNLARLIPVVRRVLKEAEERRERRRVEATIAGLNRERERMLQQRSTLLDINNAVIANLDRESLFQAIFAAVRRALVCDRMFLTLREAETGKTETVALGESLALEPDPNSGNHAMKGPIASVLQNGRLLSRKDLPPDAELPGEAELPQLGVRSYLAAPLETTSGPFGVLTIASSRPGNLSEDDKAFFSQVCHQVGLAIGNMLSFEQIARLKARLEREKEYLVDEIRSEHNFGEMVGSSPAFLDLKERIQRVAPTDATVLITGESGTGKELVARSLHSLSGRREKPLVKVNCAAISAGLVESELFGHVKGAFTGAVDRRIGRFEFADGGTIFLDEVGELPLDTQVKLLRVLQEREFEPVGSNRTIAVNVRVIAATNRRLEEAIRDGRFRSDLYFRLNVVPIELPPLRQRRSDIPDLVSSIIANCNRQFGRRIESVSEETIERMLNYDWPGNIRELQNVLARAAVLASGPVLRLGDDFLPRVPAAQSVTATPAAASRSGRAPVSDAESRRLNLAAVEREHVLRVLAQTGWVIEGPQGAASLLKLHPNTLRSRLKKLGIERPRSTT